jgi:hypothetical protein
MALPAGQDATRAAEPECSADYHRLVAGLRPLEPSLAVAAGLGTVHVINGFLASQENCGNAVTDLYRSVLGREPDAAAWPAGWLR